MKELISPWLYTTKACPLACEYCYVKQCGDAMPQKVYSRVYEVLSGLMDAGKLERVSMRISGGEPLLVFPDWKEFAEKCIARFGHVTVLTALGLRLTDEMHEFLRRPGVAVSTSLDGIAYSKPFHNGMSSSQCVMDNIDYHLLSGGASPDRIAVSTVVSDKSIGDLPKLAEWIVERNLSWGVYYDHYDRDADIARSLALMLDALDVFRTHDYDVYGKFKFNNISLKTSYGGCAAGRALCAIDCDGSVYPCQTACEDGRPVWFNVMDRDAPDKWLGTAYDNGDYKMLDEAGLPEECRSCALFDLCHGGCKLNQARHGGTRVCAMNLLVLRELIKIVKEKESANA